MKTLRLGIIGAENSHSWSVAGIANRNKNSKFRVTHIWGETPEFAAAAAAKGDIPSQVSNWRSLAGEVDGVMIDHRHGKHHASVARYFLQRGIPTFVDKPMTCDLVSSRELFDLAAKNKAPIITFSGKPLLDSFQKFVKAVKAAGPVVSYDSCGPSDLKSKYGGLFFYGIHQVDCAIEALGCEVEKVRVLADGPNGVATLFFKGGVIATLHLVSGSVPFYYRASARQTVTASNDVPDKVPYRTTCDILSKFLQDGTVPFSRERMLTPIAVLEAMQKSYRSGETVKVAKVA